MTNKNKNGNHAAMWTGEVQQFVTVWDGSGTHQFNGDKFVPIESAESPECECGNPQSLNEATGKFIGCCETCVPF